MTIKATPMIMNSLNTSNFYMYIQIMYGVWFYNTNNVNIFTHKTSKETVKQRHRKLELITISP